MKAHRERVSQHRPHERGETTERTHGHTPTGRVSSTPTGRSNKPEQQKQPSSDTAFQHDFRDVDVYSNTSGRPLDHSTRNYFEQTFQHDFAHVRVHDDAEADALAASSDAAALAVGEHLVLSAGANETETPRSRYLLAHELAHVVQFDRSRGSSIAADLESSPNDSSEVDAMRAANAVAAGETPVVQAAPTAIAPAFLGGLWDVLSGSEPKAEDEPSFMKDVVGRSLWGGATDDTIGGLADVGGLGGIAGIGEGFGNIAKPIANVLGPLSVGSGAIDMFNGLSGEHNFENNEKSVLGLGNVLSGASSIAGLFGVGGGVTGGTAMTGAGLAGAGTATGAVGGTLGAGIAAGGQVIGAGLAGYGAGKLMDKGVGWLGDVTSGDKRGLSDRMVDRAMGTNEWVDELTGSDTAGDIVGGLHLGAETLLSPAVAAGEMIGDVGSWAGKGLSGLAHSGGAWMENGIRGLMQPSMRY